MKNRLSTQGQSMLDGTKSDAGYPPHNTAEASAFHAQADALSFAIKVLGQRALRIIELEAEVKKLKATVARFQAREVRKAR